MSSKKRRQSDDLSGSEAELPVKKTKVRNGKGSKSEVPGGGSLNEKGEEYWKISNNRRVVISEYMGKTQVNVREYYEKDGQMLPGKKGISMPLDQFRELVKILPFIEGVLQKKGQKIPRPQYDQKTAVESDLDMADKAEDSKKNFEETSEEE